MERGVRRLVIQNDVAIYPLARHVRFRESGRVDLEQGKCYEWLVGEAAK
jgi:hypothetical protein